MAEVNDGNLSLLDQVKRVDPDGSVASIVEMLTQKSPLLEDMVFVEGNLPTGHRFTSRTALPSIGWRRFNEGVAASKSRTAQVDEACGMMEGTSIVDCELAKLNGNEAAFRASEDKAFLAAMNKEFEDSIFYASTKTAPEEIMGLSPRFNATTDFGGAQVKLSQITSTDADQASIWFVVWGPDTVFGIYPKGSMGGLQAYDMGTQLITDGSGNRYRAYVTNWNWKCGLCVKDWRYVVRLCNIDTSAIAKTGSLLIEDMVGAYHQLQDVTSGRAAIYCNRTIATYLHLQARDNTKNGTITVDSIGGKPVTQFLGIPIRVTDSLLNTEAIIS